MIKGIALPNDRTPNQKCLKNSTAKYRKTHAFTNIRFKELLSLRLSLFKHKRLNICSFPV